MASINYRPEIDGLRAVAVVPVILYHMDVGWAKSGYLGVDVFFVISGFLITTIISRDLEAGTFSFRDFWARRIRRIVPSLLAMVLATLAVGYSLQFKGDHPALGQQGIAAIFSFANIAMWKMHGNYFGPQAESSPFLHTWSLSVEEQFYLGLPVVLFIASRRSRQSLAPIVSWITALSFLLFLYASPRHAAATFFFLPTRAWELGAGSVLSVAYPHVAGKASYSGNIGLALIALSMVLAPASAGISLSCVVPVLGAVLVIAFANSGLAYGILSSQPLVLIGRLSYALYLWHWPVIVYSKLLGLHGQLSQAAVIGVLACLSHAFIEVPFRRSKKSIPWIGLGFATASCACGALYLAPSTYDTSQFAAPACDVPKYCANTQAQKQNRPDLLKTGVIHEYGTATPCIVVLGDSHAAMWSGTIDRIAKRRNQTISYFSAVGVDPFFDDPPTGERAGPLITAQDLLEYDKGRIAAIEAWRPKVVILATRWSVRRLDETRPLLSHLSQCGCRVLLIEAPPELGIGQHNVTQYLCYLNMIPNGGKQFLPAGHVDAYQKGRRLVAQLAKSYENCRLIRMFEQYSDSASRVFVLDDRAAVYLDPHHLTEHGTSLSEAALDAAIGEALEADSANSRSETP